MAMEVLLISSSNFGSTKAAESTKTETTWPTHSVQNNMKDITKDTESAQGAKRSCSQKSRMDMVATAITTRAAAQASCAPERLYSGLFSQTMFPIVWISPLP